MSATPVPILATGRTELIGRKVIAMMRPEYEIIQFTLAASITDELPFLLTGKAPPNPSSTLGSGDWSSSPPRALVIGGAYQDKDVEGVVKLAESIDGAVEMPWLRIDSTKGPRPPREPTQEQAQAYATAIVERIKEGLGKLREEGKLGQGKGGIYLV